MATSEEQLSWYRRFRRTGVGRIAARMAGGLIDGSCERYLRIHTSASKTAKGLGQMGDSVQYEPLNYPLLFKCVRAMQLRPDDVVFDIGCGMGRVLSVLARQRVQKCVGIDLDASLLESARENLARVRGKISPVELINADAATADYSQGTVFYIFNAFGASTLTLVLKRIRSTLETNPRRVRLMYVNPLHQDVVQAAGWLGKTQDISTRIARTRATYWESIPARLREANEERLPDGRDLMDVEELRADGEAILVAWREACK